MKPVLLNLGCGSRKLPGFINIDMEPGADLQVDLTQGLPFEDGSVQGIVSEHFIEHISQAEALRLLRECRRVLAPGGVLRIATPDLDAIVQAFQGDWKRMDWLESFGYEWIANRCEMLNIALREWDHKWVYNEEELTRLAAYAGLSFKRRWPVGESDIPAFVGLEYRHDSFVVEYVKESRASEEATPLVSVLVPAYNPKFLRECLSSAVSQTYQNLEIIVADDCPGDEVAHIVADFVATDPRVRYLRNDPPLGAFHNYLKLFDLAQGEYIKYLNDDDKLHPECVSRMVECMQANPGVTLVTSRRQMIDPEGNPLPHNAATRPPVPCSAIIDGTWLAQDLLRNGVNYVGEPTTALFRKRDLSWVQPHIFSLAGRTITWNVDVVLWLNLLSQGNAAYLFETLSYFRLHPEQEQRTPGAQERALAAWQEKRVHGVRLGFQIDEAGPIRFTPLEAPLVSIIIPTYNKWEYTAKCLDALSANTTEVSHEIIVVDNASSDVTPTALTHFGDRLRLQLNENNQGFSKACNQGARMARGKYLLFLNNDTEAQPGWLDAMVKEVEQDDSVVMVGSKLLFPDGTIQHGGVTFSYGMPYPISAMHLHYQQPPEASQERLELRAVTAACMLIRPEVFHAVGGFDEGYVNGYEDVDLCLKVGERGGRIIYTPESVLIHHESVSPGRHLREVANLDRLHRRWMGRFKAYDTNVYADIEPTPVNPERPGVSIVVVTYNSLSTIAACLETLLLHTGPQDEIILVDNASQDATLNCVNQFARRHSERVRVIRSDQNVGFSRGTNLGLNEATRDYVALVNPDVSVTTGWLDRMISYLTADPTVGAVGPISDVAAGFQRLDLYLSIKGVPSPEQVGAALAEHNPGQSRDTSLLGGFCLLTRRALLQELGNLDPNLFLGNDDLDLSLSLRKRGYKLLVATDAFVRHFGQVSFEGEPASKGSYLLQQSANMLYEKLHREYNGNVPSPQELWNIAWYTPTKGLTSIVMLVHNNLDLTRQCIDSIYEHTPLEFELILVDNGSGAEVAAYVAELRNQHGNVRYVRNEQNQGYAFGCNQGLELARGEYVVLLNNDVIVTAGWLSKQLALLTLDPAVGMVGPRTNYTAGVQMVDGVPYTDLAGMHAFADRWFVENAGQFSMAARITGLCMVLRREVIEMVGGLDTAFGIGNFEDDDFCLRVLRAGYRIAIAHDVFIHHYGSATFKALSVDYDRLLRQNWQFFRHKWQFDGEIEHGYHAAELAGERAFDPDWDYVPLRYEEAFHRETPPLALDSQNPHRLLCIPDWSDDSWKEPLARCLQAFTKEDPVSLVIRVEPPLPEVTEAAWQEVSALIEQLGRSEGSLPDVIFETTAIPPRFRGSLYTACTAYIPTGGNRDNLYRREAEECALPVVDAASTQELTGLLEAR